MKDIINQNGEGHEDFRSERKILPLSSFHGLGAEELRVDFYAPEIEEAEEGEADCIAHSNSNPTEETNHELVLAYDYFNEHLFHGQLPHCLITLQRKRRAMGYFCAERFINNQKQITDEIALNPSYFAGEACEEVLSTLVHEMTHLWQQHFGEPGRGRYHNRQWAAKMECIGLIPSDTGKPGGRKTGDSMSHYVVGGGPFDFLARGLTGTGFQITWRDKKEERGSGGDAILSEPENRSNRFKFHCPSCGLNAWAKSSARLVCGVCFQSMVTTGEVKLRR